MSKIALIGASGFVGSALLKEALDRGNQTTAIVRHPEKISIENPLLHVVGLDINKADKLAKQLGGHDVVISAYNPGWTNPNIYDDFIKGAQSIQQSVKQSGVKRFIVIGGAGSLYINGVQLIDTPEFPEVYKPGARAARDYFNMLKEEKELNWTFFSPAIEMSQQHPGIRTGNYRLNLDEPVFDKQGHSRLSVEDLAVVILDEVEQNKHIKKRFTAGY